MLSVLLAPYLLQLYIDPTIYAVGEQNRAKVLVSFRCFVSGHTGG